VEGRGPSSGTRQGLNSEAGASGSTCTVTAAIPRTSAAIGGRISLAFRVKPDQQPPKASGNSGV
jgi:hypothetical protein